MNEAEKIIAKYRAGKCSDQEIVILQRWLHDLAEDNQHADWGDLFQVRQHMWEGIHQKTLADKKVFLPKQKIIYWAAAAIFFVGLGTLLLYGLLGLNISGNKLQDNLIMPGAEMATLTLSNGKKILLANGPPAGEIDESGVRILRTGNGVLAYKVANSGTDTTLVNTLSTAEGQQFQIYLPDGSLVYLNASSSISYSTALSKTAKRKVHLSGEAYFEVSKNKNHPFEVFTDHQMVEVLGTHFNVRRYSDDPNTQTTLIEGSVKVSSQGPLTKTVKGNSRVLKPGEQSRLKDGVFQVSEVMVDDVVSWKNKKFSFQSEEIQVVMRDVARWYNVEISYQDDVQRLKVSGSLSRFDDLGKLLDKLSKTGLFKFRVSGRKVTISKA